MSPRTTRYSGLMIALHWCTAIAVLAAYALSEGGTELRQDPPLLHFAFGLSVLALLAARLTARAFGGTPPPDATEAGWPVKLAKLNHAALYFLLLAIPMSGWYVASRLGLLANFFGLRWPALTAVIDGPPGFVAILHQVGGNLLLVLAGFHGSLALWHHFVKKDDTLKRMSPFHRD